MRTRILPADQTGSIAHAYVDIDMEVDDVIVVGVGALMCAIGSWFAHKFYKGEKLPFELLAPPSAADEFEMAKSSGRANVPITPDVAYSGKV